MSRKKRQAINKANGARSKGPKTEQGKQQSRRNALKHGLCARTLALATEDPLEVQAALDQWDHTLQPKDAQEKALADSAALHYLKLQRVAKAEAAIIDEQQLRAPDLWDRDQRLKLQEHQHLLIRDSDTAVAHLESYGAGARWCLQRMERIEKALHLLGDDKGLTLVRYAARQVGCTPRAFRAELARPEGFGLAFWADRFHERSPTYGAKRDPLEEVERDTPRLSDWVYEALCDVLPDDLMTREAVEVMVSERVAQLRALVAHFEAIDRVSRAGSVARAGILADTRENNLLMRYARSAEMGLNRAIGTLQKLQKERRKNEMECDGPNEPNVPPGPEVKAEPSGASAASTVSETAPARASAVARVGSAKARPGSKAPRRRAAGGGAGSGPPKSGL